MKHDAIIVDIDSTISNLLHRYHYIAKNPKDWDSFYLACDKDIPIPSTIKTVKDYYEQDYTIILMTGRPEYVREKTTVWLQENNIPYDLLLMRPDEDRRKSVFFKREQTAKLINLFDVKLAIDDETPNIEMFKEFNIPTLQIELFRRNP